MYDFLNDTAGREHHQALIEEARRESFARKVQAAQSKQDKLSQVKTIIIKTMSAIIR